MIKLHPNVDNIISREGGFKQGHLFEVYGPDGSGKTTFAILLMASAQKQGLQVGYIEVEYLDKEHAEHFGLDWDALDIRSPETAEEALGYVMEMCNSGYGLVVLDSVAGMATEEQMEAEEIGATGQYAQIASLLAKELPKIKSLARKNNTCVIFTNQIRANIQRFGMGPETQSYGGYTLKHTVSARFEIRRVSWIKYSDKVIGYKMKIRAPQKNRFAPPNRDGYLDIICDHDINMEKINLKRKTKIEFVQPINTGINE